MLTFCTDPMSRGRIARRMLEEVGAPCETVPLDYAASMKAPEYLAINPMGKVPAPVHDGRVVAECAAICTCLADACPEAGLGHGSLDASQGTLSAAPHLAGEGFPAADVHTGSQIAWAMMFGTIEPRPAAIRARGIDDALVPPKA